MEFILINNLIYDACDRNNIQKNVRKKSVKVLYYLAYMTFLTFQCGYDLAFNSNSYN